MRYPKNLPPNGTIGFVAPSFGCNIEPYKSAFQNAGRRFVELGYQLDLGPNCYQGKGVGISNLPYECAKELAEYYLREQNDMLISCGGGELMCEILDDIDFEKIKAAEPKWYMGYSDNTNMTYLLTTLCDTASIYGPNAPAFGMNPWHSSLLDAILILTGQTKIVRGYDRWEKESLKSEEQPLLPYNVTEPRILKIYQNGQFIPNAKLENVEVNMSGRLLGGCMDCLATLVGTKYDKTVSFCEKYKKDGIIWFLEACDLNVFGIRRVLWQMEHAGWFKHVKGFLFGRPANGEAMMGLDAYQAVLEVTKKYNVPVIMDLDIGHRAPMMPLVTGSVATVTINGNNVQVEMDFA